MEVNNKEKQPQDEVVEEESLSFKLAELDKSFKGLQVDWENDFAHIFADSQPGYGDEVVHQLDGLTSDFERIE